jgi:hypothetical protein
METSCSSVDHAHKLRDGILVYFDDGRIAFFSASLLCAALPLAIEFRDADLDGDLGSANTACCAFTCRNSLPKDF